MRPARSTAGAEVESGDANTPCLLGHLQSLCVGGLNNGADCATDSDCPKACKGGTNHGLACTTNSQCPPAGVGKCEGVCDERTLGPEPFYKLSSQWGTVKLHGANIVPNTSYRVRTQVDLPSGIARSATTTGTTRIWGDVDGDSDADGIDVTGSVNAFRHQPGAPPFEGATSAPTAIAARRTQPRVAGKLGRLFSIGGRDAPCSAILWCRALDSPKEARVQIIAARGEVER